MKRYNLLFLFFFLLFFVLNLNGGYWIKKIDVQSGQYFGHFFYNKKNGTIFSLREKFIIFDITGKVDLFGYFIHESTAQTVQIEKTVILDDSTFFSIGHSNFHSTDPKAHKYYILRFNQFGEVLFSKELKVDAISRDRWGLLRFNNKIKVVGDYTDNVDKDYKVILTFSETGALLKSKILNCNEDYYTLSASEQYNCMKTDSDQYIIVKSGSFKKDNNWNEGILFLKFNKNDEIIESKFYYVKKDDKYFEYFQSPVLKKNSDKGFSILSTKQRNYFEKKNSMCNISFLKIDSKYNVKWSREYTLEMDYLQLDPVNLFEDNAGYTLSLSSITETMNDSPALLRINKNGNYLWSKKYNAGGLDREYLRDLIKLPNGSLAMSTGWGYIYILDDKGDVPGGCNVIEKVSVKTSIMNTNEETVNKNIFKYSNINIFTDETDIRFFKESDSRENTFCEYLTMDGELKIIEERSIFWGYFIHKIKFSVDSKTSSYISKFKVYRKNHSDKNYVFVSEILKEEGKTSYNVEFAPIYSKNYTYRVLAVNSDDEVVDMVNLYGFDR